MRDPLTYTCPRTWAEVISRHQCAGDEAVAVWRFRRPLAHRLADLFCAACVGGVLLCAALAYFDVLIK